jgi:hypothetical protein
MVYNPAGLTRGGQTKPSEDISPALKSDRPDYSLAMAKFIHGQYGLGKCLTRPNEQDGIALLRAYAEGRQPSELYKNIILGKKTPGAAVSEDGDSAWADIFSRRDALSDIDFESVFSPAPKYLLNIQGLMDAADFDLEVEAVDESSISQKINNAYRDLVDGDFQNFFEYVNLTMGLPEGPKKPIPSSFEEMQMFQQMNAYKLAYEVAMGYALKYTREISADKKVKRKVIADLLTLNKALVFAYADSARVTKYKYVDIADAILENSNEEDASDISWGGVVLYETIADFRADNPYMTEDQVTVLASNFSGFMGNGSDTMAFNNDGTSTFDTWRIPVLNAWWKGTDTEYTTKHSDGRSFKEEYKKNGTRPPKIFDTNYRKTTKESIRRLYHCKWVVSTEHVYDYGLCKDIPFDYYTKDVRLPFMLFKIPGKSIMEQMVPILNNIQLTYLGLQNAIAKSPPPGLSIDIGSIENVSFGNKKVHPLDVIKVYSRSGNLLYRMAPGDPNLGKIANQRPIEQMASMLDSAIAGGIASLERWFMEIERVTGISQNSVSSTDPGQGLGVTQINLATTNNTLKPLLIGWQTIASNLGTYCANKIQSVIVTSEKSDCAYYDILGAPSYAAIKAAGSYPPAAWGCFIKARIDQQAKTALMEAAKAGLQVGQNGIAILSFSDYLFIVDKIENGGSVASIRAFIAYREQKASEASMQRANEAKVLEGKVNEQLATVKSQAEQQSKAIDYQSAVGVIQEQFKADAMLAKIEHEFKLKEMAEEKAYDAQDHAEDEEVDPSTMVVGGVYSVKGKKYKWDGKNLV